MSNELAYTISPVEPDELNFVLSSLKRSFREFCGELRTNDYYRLQGAVCDELLSRFPLVLEARNPDGVLLGWLLCEATPQAFVLHYSYVKSYARRKGVAKALLAAALDALPDAGEALLITHKTRHYPTATKMGFQYMPVGRFLQENR